MVLALPSRLRSASQSSSTLPKVIPSPEDRRALDSALKSSSSWFSSFAVGRDFVRTVFETCLRSPVIGSSTDTRRR